jgi:transposase-like protein
VPARLSPTERIRAQIDELFAGGQPLAETLEEAARLSVRLVIQAALEAEVSEFLGRDRYQRRPDAGPGHRNGHQPIQVKTTAGPVVLERPKLRATSQPFVSRLLGKGVSRTNALEALVLASFVRGLSVRDVEAALAEALGPEAALSKSTVCRICQVIKEEFDAFTTRDLGGVEVDYLFLDGAHFRYHPGAPAEPILVAWGVTTTGGPLLLGLAPGSDEGTDPWAGFLEELTGRGLGAPLLVITDGAPGLISAVELAFPRSLRQRCLIHRARNVLAKVPTHAQAEVKAAFWGIFDGIDAPPGDQAVAEARRRADAFADRYQHRYPAAVSCLTDTLPELTVFLRFPREHWHRIRHTNLIERTFGETRRRTKVIGRLPGERSCLGLVWAVLDRASRGWRGVTQTPAGVRLLQDLRRDLRLPPHRQPDKEVTHPPVATAA